jgi:hypothetical protein
MTPWHRCNHVSVHLEGYHNQQRCFAHWTGANRWKRRLCSRSHKAVQHSNHRRWRRYIQCARLCQLGPVTRQQRCTMMHHLSFHNQQRNICPKRLASTSPLPVRRYIYVCVYIYIYICMYVCTHTYIYIYIHMCLWDHSIKLGRGGGPLSPHRSTPRRHRHGDIQIHIHIQIRHTYTSEEKRGFTIYI